MTPDIPAGPGSSPPARWATGLPALVAATVLFVISLGLYIAEVSLHRRGEMLTWYDLHIYLISGMHARYHPAILYTWQAAPETKFVYTPFAALLFYVAARFAHPTADALTLVTSLAAIPLTVWLTLKGMGLTGRARHAVALGVSAFALWVFPVISSLHLGQIEPLLLLLVVWDLTQQDGRRWKGVGVGIAAGVKLVPLIFIPYLLLAGKVRQAVVATVTFAVTIAIGFVFLPGPSHKWWITGYMLNTKKNGSMISLVNQSLLAMLTRAYHGDQAAARPVWLVSAVVLAVLGLGAAALLSRAGKPVHGMVTCALLGLLLSPISWSNHWVWIVPLMAMLGGLAVTSAGRLRWAYLSLLALTMLAFGAWPDRLHGPLALLPGQAFLGWFAEPPVNIADVSHLRGTQVLTWNLYVVAGLVLLALMCAAGWRARQSFSLRRTSARRSGTAPAQKQPSAGR